MMLDEHSGRVHHYYTKSSGGKRETEGGGGGFKKKGYEERKTADRGSVLGWVEWKICEDGEQYGRR